MYVNYNFCSRLYFHFLNYCHCLTKTSSLQAFHYIFCFVSLIESILSPLAGKCPKDAQNMCERTAVPHVTCYGQRQGYFGLRMKSNVDVETLWHERLPFEAAFYMWFRWPEIS